MMLNYYLKCFGKCVIMLTSSCYLPVFSRRPNAFCSFILCEVVDKLDTKVCKTFADVNFYKYCCRHGGFMALSAVQTVYMNTSVKDHLSSSHCLCFHWMTLFNPIAVRKAKIVYNFGLSECNRVKRIYTTLARKG